MNVIQIPRRLVQSHWGGTETVILETAKRLLAQGHWTEVLCPNALAKSNIETIKGVHITRTSYFYPYLGLSKEARLQLDQKGGNLFSFSLLNRLKRWPGLDLIHLHTAKRLGGIVRRVAKKRRIPYLVSLHGGASDVPAAEAVTWTAPTNGCLEWGKVLGWWVGSRKVLDDAAAILCVGKREQQKTQEQFPNKRVIYMPNGVDSVRFHAGDGNAFRAKYDIPQNAQVILCVSRIDPQKNQLLAVRVLHELRKENKNLYLVLVGPVTDQNYHRQLEDEVKLLSLSAYVRIIGQLDADSNALTDAYHSSDVFLLPSIHEPFGIVILEAWSAGLPVVASRVGGIPFFVDDGADGLLFGPNDMFGCALCLSRLLRVPAQRKVMAQTGKNKAIAEYSWDRVTSKLIDLYDEVIRANPVRQ